jgi:CBS domain containing-hemolysin-like protein
MEEIFGEIDDEHDKEDLVEITKSETEFVFSARLETDYINDKYQFNLPVVENVETLGGLIMHYHESIPKLNEKIKVENFLFAITAVSKARIELINLQVLSEDVK